MTVQVCVDHINSSVMWTQWNLMLSNQLHDSPVDLGGMILPFPIVYAQLLGLGDVEGDCHVTTLPGP
jgi:hypothetical protein